MPTRDEIFEKVRESLVEALGVEEDEVEPSSSLIGDLGAESIDFLDLVFRLEKEFDVKIPKGDLFPDHILSTPEFVQGGSLTEAGVAELRSRMPHADLSGISATPTITEVLDIFTVDAVVTYLHSKVNGEAPPVEG
jgi:acyl carrier protein